MPTVGFIDCPHCVEKYIIPGWPPSPKPPILAKVYVKCSVCKNTLEFRVVEIDVAYHSLESKPHAAVVRIEPPTPNNEPKFYDVPACLPKHVTDSINSQISNTS